MTRTKPCETEASALACDIVADAFGHDCGLVCRVLAQRGSMTLRELARETHLRSSRCQQAILVMIRHNSIRIMQQENNGAGKLSSTLVQTHQHMPNVDEEDNRYQINLEAVLYRLRYSRYLLHIRECYGKTQELFFEVLFQHGMLHTHELFARISVNQYRLDISRTNTTILEQGTNLRSNPKTAHLEDFLPDNII